MRVHFAAILLALAATPSTAAELPKDQWRENLAFLAKELPARHIDLFFHLPRPDWETRVATLEKAIDNLSDLRIRIELTKLVAAVGDSHTGIDALTVADSRYIYLGYREFPDGLYIIDTIAPYKQAMGARVVAIDGMPVDEVRRRIDPLVAAENDIVRRTRRRVFLPNATVLRELGVVRNPGQVEFTFERDGRTFPMLVKTLPAYARIPQAERPAPVRLPDPLPLWLKHRDTPYWWEYLGESGTLYLQYNSCVNGPKLSFADFTRQVVEQARRLPPQRLVIDLRHNSGGNSSVSDPLMAAISSEKSLRPAAGTYVLIGEATYSSGEFVALELKRSHKAILVGEPAGQKPNAYGDIRPFQLPHGGITVMYSTKRFHMMPASDPPALMPDRLVTISAADYLSGRDPVLAAVTR